MKQLYFGDTPTTLSTILIIGFIVFFSIVTSRHEQINRWGWMVPLVLLFGILMSAMSGTKDKVGTPEGIFPVGQFVFILASVFGGVAIFAGILALIIRKQEFWQFSFYALSGIIFMKTLFIEISRIVIFMKG